MDERAVGRGVELASGLLMLLDAHRITGRLPLAAQTQAARLRHAVKLAVQATAVAPSLRAPAPPRGPTTGRSRRRRWPRR